jgi:hypothetical protein
MSPLISIIILAAILWFVFWAVDAGGVPAPMNWMIKLVVALLVIVKALALIGIGL